jgi:hypothetical protein
VSTCARRQKNNELVVYDLATETRGAARHQIFGNPPLERNQMKYTSLLLLGLALLPHAVQANQTSVSVCVEALEQLKTLHLAAPVYKLNEGQERQYLADADRPAEVDRLKTIVTESCSAEPDIRRGEESEAEHLHIARSPGCMGDRDILSTMEKPESRTPEDDIARHRKRVAARCPDVDLSNVWLILGVPVT